MVQGVTPAHKGLAPSRLISYLRYDKDAHAGHTHRFIANNGYCGKSVILETRKENG
tara:strand:+ start:119 stop:286 length:168 start_codon:yes stop_codon:yes gene_type:complete